LNTKHHDFGKNIARIYIFSPINYVFTQKTNYTNCDVFAGVCHLSLQLSSFTPSSPAALIIVTPFYTAYLPHITNACTLFYTQQQACWFAPLRSHHPSPQVPALALIPSTCHLQDLTLCVSFPPVTGPRVSLRFLSLTLNCPWQGTFGRNINAQLSLLLLLLLKTKLGNYLIIITIVIIKN